MNNSAEQHDILQKLCDQVRRGAVFYRCHQPGPCPGPWRHHYPV